MNHFRKNFIELLEKSSKSQVEIAKELGISKQQLSNWKVGFSMPNYDDLIKLANYFEVSTDELLGNNNINK